MKFIARCIPPILGFLLLGFILSVSIKNNGGVDATFASTDKQILFYNIFKLAGLTAFTLLSYQILTGPYMRLWEKLYGEKFYRFHAFEGIFVLVFAVTHWLLIHAYMWLANLSISEFDVLYEKPFIYFGPLALVFIAVTVITAILTVLLKWTKFERIWWVHWLNYVIFFLVFFHSINIGSDVASLDSSLRPIWYFFFVGAIIGLIYRRVYVPLQKKRDTEVVL